MKKILISIILSVLLIPGITFATVMTIPLLWDSVTNISRTILPTGSLQAAYFTATSTSATSTFASKVSIGTTTPKLSSDFTVMRNSIGNGSIATTTIEEGNFSTTTSVVCHNTKNTDGATISFYFVGTTMVVENSSCK